MEFLISLRNLCHYIFLIEFVLPEHNIIDFTTFKDVRCRSTYKSSIQYGLNLYEIKNEINFKKHIYQ